VTYRCLVVDDEPLARSVLIRHVAEVPSLELVGQCSTAPEAAAFLHERPADVLFLDIRMPGLTGLELLDTLTRRPQVILTTAFAEYALEGYEHAVVDYLLKPISFERFLQAVNKLRPVDPTASGRPESLLLRVAGGFRRIRLADITVLEACGNYVKIHTRDGHVLASQTLKTLVGALPGERFLQVHRSFVVAVELVDRLASSSLRVAGRDIPVGRSYRKVVEERFRSRP
jgi:DNA-binding LytR/AlgR family response regulator